MTRFDFAPLHRSTVGFDRLFNMIERGNLVEDPATAYPPYNIEKTGDNAYRITMAVAGFGEDELDLEYHDGKLTVTGKLSGKVSDGNFLHRGIAGREFKRTFQLADYMKVVGAALENGLLHIELEREIPEAMKPRKIELKHDGTEGLLSKATKTLKGSKAA